MTTHFKCWAAAGLMTLFMGTAAAAPQIILPKTAITASAADTINEYKIGKLIYTVNESAGTATVKGLNLESVSNGVIESVQIPDTVSYKSGKSAKVTQIGERAFYNRSSFKSVDMSKATNLIAIGKEAFSKTNLTSVTLPNTVKTLGNGVFYNCSCLSSVTLSNAFTSIPANTFCLCKKLTQITIPASVTSIGAEAFASCETLNKVTFASGSKLTGIGDEAFQNCLKLPSVSVPASVTSIGDFAFDNCPVLKTVSFASGSQLNTIGSHSFEKVPVAKITIPATVTKIGSYAFQNCTSLTSFAFASGSKLSEIGNYAFDGCSNIASVAFPSSLKTIGTYAFRNCDKIQKITIPAAVQSIGTYAFYDLDSLTSVSIGKGVTSIGDAAFGQDKKLSAISVNASNTAYTIYNGALYTKNYQKLVQYPPAIAGTVFTAHENTKTVAPFAFRYLVNLQSVDFSKTSGMSIGSQNFCSDCKAITKLSIPSAENKPENGANVLKKYNNLFTQTSLFYLNGSPLVKNIGNTAVEPTFHSTIAEAMYDVFDTYNDTIMMDKYLDAVAKYAVQNAYKTYGKSIDPGADVNNLSEFEKAYAIFKWVNKRAKYDSDEYRIDYNSAGQVIRVVKKRNDKNHCDASVFLHRGTDKETGKPCFYSVCDGYARAYNLIMKAAGLECYYVFSGDYAEYYTDANGKRCTSNNSHAFNCIKIGKHYYIADPTNNIIFPIYTNFMRAFLGFSTPDKWEIKSCKTDSSSLRRHPAPPTTINLNSEVRNIFGDLNDDTYQNNSDFALLQFSLVKQITLNKYQAEKADLNGDGTINFKDAQVLKWYLKNYCNQDDKFTRMGDIDGNGVLESSDYTRLYRYVYYNYNDDMPNDLALNNADLNNDGIIDEKDVTKLRGLIDYKIGDVNRDGKVNTTDKDLIQKYIAKKITLSDAVLWYADVNGDGAIDISDVVKLSALL